MLAQSTPLAPATLEAVIDQYFEGFNQENYGEVAALFCDRGLLLPPFEAEIIGPQAIAHYLQQEAQGMRAIPLERQVELLDQGDHQVTVKGRVKTTLFTVNVQWLFLLDPTGAIQRAEIKLLASLQELLQFNRG
jgi:ketosteroid isomerase-like protein